MIASLKPEPMCSWSPRELSLPRRYMCATRILVPALVTFLFKDLQPFLSKQTCCRDALDASWSCYCHSQDTLVVGDPRDFNVSVTVRNDGEDSYGTRATIYYPSGLSYRKVSVNKVANSSSVSGLCFPHPLWLAVDSTFACLGSRIRLPRSLGG